VHTKSKKNSGYEIFIILLMLNSEIRITWLFYEIRICNWLTNWGFSWRLVLLLKTGKWISFRHVEKANKSEKNEESAREKTKYDGHSNKSIVETLKRIKILVLYHIRAVLLIKFCYFSLKFLIYFRCQTAGFSHHIDI